MSRGYGRIQRELLAIFSESGARFTTLELAARVYGLPVKAWHIVNINRALEDNAKDFKLTSCRAGSQGLGCWRHTWWRA